LKNAPPTALAENPHYKLLLDHASRYEYAAKEYPEEIKRLREELDQLHATRKEFEDDMIVRLGSIILGHLCLTPLSRPLKHKPAKI
jgi:hypothetical protein